MADRSLQQDLRSILVKSRSIIYHPHLTTAIAEHDMAMARQFFDAQQATGPGPSFSPSQVPPMQDLMSRQFALTAANRGAVPNLNDAWADIQRTQAAHSLPHNAFTSTAWASEFKPAAFTPGPTIQQSVPLVNSTQNSHLIGNGFGTMGSRFGLNAAPQAYLQGFDAHADVKGKGKFQETDFDAAFAQAASSITAAQIEIQSSGDAVDELEKDLNNARLDDVPAATPEDLLGEAEFKSVWEQMQNSDMPPKPEEMAKWEAEFNQLMNAQREEGEWEYSSSMQRAWDEGVAADLDDSFTHNMKFDHEGLPILDPYVFEQNNKYLDPSSSTQSPLALAKQMLEHNASLSEVALLLEAAIQKGELGEGGYEAWILLGETRNMDEREEAGMKALTEGVRSCRRSGCRRYGDAPISYTNESLDRASHTMLMRWLCARFPDVPVPPEAQSSLTRSSWHSHNVVTDAFLTVARTQHAQGVIDPDVQLALGVLFYTNGAYDRAKDCFESALSVRPTDYLLWNRLGSSLSNGNKPEESLGAYREALMLRPTYTRAIYNVGVACLNIGAHKEAAEHLLSALSMQETTGDKSKQLWQTLRRAFIAMDRKDLADLTKRRPLSGRFPFGGVRVLNQS
ncbi:peroxisome targeting signal receptor [Lactarius akahatsu]|uniref:Peroxisome targeting signal receptor n=1 Tax=Lactarius akahatsu TaxID=416441 RepID=A0AAD4QAA4_9AGAM|nr:peroxisome targeting signal receptor [Lactarius akahatsu]